MTDGENVEITDEYVILKADSSNTKVDTGGDGNNVYNGDNNNHSPATGRTDVNAKRHSHTNASGIDDDIRIYGLWIYSEPPPNSTAETRTLNARIIKECAVHAGQSLKFARETLEAAHQTDLRVAAAVTNATTAPTEEVQGAAGVPMGRQISLQDLFGRQRAVDDEWSVRAHNLGPGELNQQDQMQMQMHAPAIASGPPPGPKQDVLGDLFRRAGLAYQGTNQ